MNMAAVIRKSNKQDHTNEFKQAMTRITLRNGTVFFVALLYSLIHERHDPLVIRGQRAPAATDGVRLYYDGEAFGKYSLDDRQFIIVHEILHVVLYHSLRRGIREPNLWNIACDYVVNGMITEDNDFKMPAEGIQPDPAFKGMSAEQVYDLLQQEAEQALAGGKSEGKGKNGRTWVRGDPDDGDGDGEPGDQPGSGSGTSLKGKGQNPNDVTDYDPEKNEGKSAQQVEREIGVATEKANAAAKAAGQGSALMKQLLHDAQVQHEPWFAHLRRYMNVLSARQYNWAVINRRRAVLHNVLAPDLKSECMGDLILTIDESGSMSDRALAAIGKHCAAIFREARPKRVIVIRHCDEVTDVEIHEGPDYSDFVIERRSTGGTSFIPLFEYIGQEHGDAQVALCFTDMYGAFPEAPPIDTIWVTSTTEKAVATPFGERIQADFND